MSIELLNKIYNDPKQWLVGLRSLYEKANELRAKNDPPITLNQVRKFLLSIAAHQVNQPIRKQKRKDQRQILARAPGHIYQMDLTDMSVYAKSNFGIKYLLTCIDIDSRYAWARPLKNKTAEGVLEEFKVILEDKIPDSISTDNGSEFKGLFGQYVYDNNIKHTLNQPGDHNHMGIIESFHKTLRSRISKYMTINNTTRYVDKLDDIIEGYNNTKHSTTKGKPIDIFNGKAFNRQTVRVYKETGDFKIGDTVRILNDKKQFEKGTVPRWSADVFVIEEKVKNKYKTSHGAKLYRDVELKKAKPEDAVFDLRKKTNKLIANKKIANELKRDDIDKKNIIASRLRNRSGTRGKRL